MFRCAAIPLLALATTGCLTPGGDALDFEQRPFVDEWRVAVDRELSPDASSVRIGGVEYDNNFANRGDVMVIFGGPPGRILIEMRRFTWAGSAELAQEDFDGLGSWAYPTYHDAPLDPRELPEFLDCLGEGEAWLDGCGFRTHYDGLSQPSRLGADLRLTLPLDYTGRVEVVTEDNIAESSYLNRGNVCVTENRAEVDVKLERGRAFVTMGATGRASVVADAGDIWFDVPAGAWSAVDVSYSQAGEVRGCFADLTLAGFEESVSNFMGDIVSIFGEANRPEMGAGGPPLVVAGSTSECALVPYSEHPSEFLGPDRGADQPVETRGRVYVCNDCETDRGTVRQTVCETLLPGVQ